jgi:hypothetical protein
MPLHLVAAAAAQAVELLERLDALGDHAHAQAVRQRHDRFDQRRAVGVAGDVLHEGTVDLEHVHRQALQVRQARVAGAEVVDRQFDAHALQAQHGVDRGLDVVHHHAFGQLDLERIGRQPGLVEHLRHRRHQVGFGELARRQVDRHPQRSEAGALPFPVLPAGGAQHPLADRDDQASFLGQGNEPVRAHAAQQRMAPAQQCFGADHGTAGQVDLGLEVQLELPGRQCAPQRTFQRQALEGVRVHVRRVETHPVAADGLGAVHGDLGVLDQGVGVGAVGRPGRHPGTAAEHQRLPLELQRQRHRVAHLLHPRGGLALVGAAGQHQHEVVAADPGRGVARTQRADDAHGQRAQRGVAGAPAQGVVDQLEVVDVERHHPYRQRAGVRDGAPEAVGEQRAVGQAGQRIVVGVSFQLGFVALGDRDVVHDHHEVRDEAAGIAHRRHVHVAHQFGAVAGALGHQGVAGAPLVQRPAQLAQRGQVGIEPGDGAQRLAGQLRRGNPEHLLAGRVDVVDRVVGRARIHQQDRIGGRLHRLAVQAQRAAGPFQRRGAFADQRLDASGAPHPALHQGGAGKAQHQAQRQRGQLGGVAGQRRRRFFDHQLPWAAGDREFFHVAQPGAAQQRIPAPARRGQAAMLVGGDEMAARVGSAQGHRQPVAVEQAHRRQRAADQQADVEHHGGVADNARAPRGDGRGERAGAVHRQHDQQALAPAAALQQGHDAAGSRLAAVDCAPGEGALLLRRPGVVAVSDLVAVDRGHVIVDQVALAPGRAHQGAAGAALADREAGPVARALGLERRPLGIAHEAVERQRQQVVVARRQRRGKGVEFGAGDVLRSLQEQVHGAQRLGRLVEGARHARHPHRAALHELGAGAVGFHRAHRAAQQRRQRQPERTRGQRGPRQVATPVQQTAGECVSHGGDASAYPAFPANRTPTARKTNRNA